MKKYERPWALGAARWVRTHLADEAGVVWKRFGVTAQSTFVLLDADEQVTFKGRLDADEVPGAVAALLG